MGAPLLFTSTHSWRFNLHGASITPLRWRSAPPDSVGEFFGLQSKGKEGSLCRGRASRRLPVRTTLRGEKSGRIRRTISLAPGPGEMRILAPVAPPLQCQSTPSLRSMRAKSKKGQPKGL